MYDTACVFVPQEVNRQRFYCCLGTVRRVTRKWCGAMSLLSVQHGIVRRASYSGKNA